ncbi:MAG: hypothetical protein A2015_09580 [Spirochaetes bacterium GWF1_31_7]|nr:MAG: hypothetical protein A2Y30_00845 [Spirochaetes bacterium GWE1_32_154]OHD45959.1 MAG: hypothetical protein A2Y29_16690 [Spirochaetes bacterium GWE2_31_10]OHD52613.1 MAG: hypothetical protein A2015_09580 [Spirochaetes bacterium GWF1_31_7]OHD73540.1 MAG: hypothetical protein A2355_15375 [Spirochaetes bacterium RIFOXYB1_FULL_32_8]HBD95827.1 hypothetical protein [Spirochaetia bacterium]
MNLKEKIAKIVDFDPNMIKIADLIQKSKKIAILGHADPDIDCIGSQISLQKALCNLGFNAYTVNNGPFENNLSSYKDLFIPEVLENTDLIIVVDNSSVDRISSNKKIDLSKTVVIDHHYTNSGYGLINFVNENYVSASEMVFILLAYMNVDFSDKEITQWLLNGILSDNGYYRHIRVDKFFSLIASYFLIELGADPSSAYKNMFCNSSVNDVKLLGLLLNRIESTKNELIVSTWINDEDKNRYLSSVSSLFLFKEMMTIKNAKIFIFYKIIENENKVIVSLRSDEEYNVAAVAEQLGGGGHKVAAGASVQGSYAEVKEKVLSIINDLIK